MAVPCNRKLEMMHLTLILEDNLLTATHYQVPLPPEAQDPNHPEKVAVSNETRVKITCQDLYCPHQIWHGDVSTAQYEAIVTLAVNGESRFDTELYELANAGLEGCPPQCRPIP